MKTTKKLLMALAALAALAFGGAAIANATGANGDGDGETNDDGPDATLVHSSAGDRAAGAATTSLGGGKVVSVEKSDEGGAAVYEVKVDQGGKITEVQVGKDFAVTSKKADDDQGDGDGETNDD